MASTPIQSRPTRVHGHDEIAAIIGAEILSGQRLPGDRIPSAEELYERFGASRALMREVSKTLAAKGMITAKSRVGTQVLPPEHWNWFDPDVLAWRVRIGLDEAFFRYIAEVRRAVEPAGAALAAERRSADDLRQMRGALERMALAGANRHAFAEADLDLHIAVAAASGNPLFRSFAAVIETALGAYFSLSAPAQNDRAGISIARHAAIADAIEARDGAAAARAMLAVIDEGLESVTRSA